MKAYETYIEEMKRALLEYGNENHKDGFLEGYGAALNDFYSALKYTNMTPEEIMKKLKLK